MEDKIKEIVSVFIKVPADRIGADTAIGRAAVQSSILLHRMYARLADEGVVVEDYTAIKVFGDLIRREAKTSVNDLPAAGHTATVDMPAFSGNGVPAAGIGIDIEEVASLPRAADFRKETFYTLNFSAGEISYCILQADPYASLTGLFAVKEAIVKADAGYRNRPFHTVEIGHSAEGRPLHAGFDLSISHAGGLAVAVAVRGTGVPTTASPAPLQAVQEDRKQAYVAWIGWMALLVAAAALLVALKH